MRRKATKHYTITKYSAKTRSQPHLWTQFSLAIHPTCFNMSQADGKWLARSLRGPAQQATMFRFISRLPSGYHLTYDPDVLFVNRSDGSTAATFSVKGLNPEVVQQCVMADIHKESELGRTETSARDTSSVHPCLRVRVFGHFEVLCADEPIHLGRNNKALAILKYLLAHRTRQTSQDYLMAWLWPESSAKRARGSLNTAVHTVRKWLSSCSLPEGCSSHILLEEGYYRVCPAVRISTDADEFDSHCLEASALKEAGHTSRAAEEYERAVGLYRGDYLADDLYEEWTMIERQRLINNYIGALQYISQHYLDTGQGSKSLSYCYRILDKDPCHESGHYLLMKYYAKRGLSTQALRQYNVYDQMLREKLGLVPSQKVQDYYRAILRSAH